MEAGLGPLTSVEQGGDLVVEEEVKGVKWVVGVKGVVEPLKLELEGRVVVEWIEVEERVVGEEGVVLRVRLDE